MVSSTRQGGLRGAPPMSANTGCVYLRAANSSSMPATTAEKPAVEEGKVAGSVAEMHWVMRHKVRP